MFDGELKHHELHRTLADCVVLFEIGFHHFLQLLQIGDFIVGLRIGVGLEEIAEDQIANLDDKRV